jgi:phosphate transport system permease protein
MTSLAPSPEAERPRPFDPTAPLVASGNLRRRQLVSRLVQGGSTVSAIAAVAVLGLVVYAVVDRGAKALTLHFFTQSPPLTGGVGGGIADAIVGSAVIVALGSIIAVPLGVLCALYLVEFAGPRSRSGSALRLILDMMQGLPSVVIGLFILGLIVETEHAESGFAGSLALAIIMLPLIARTAQEVLLTIPQGLRDASDALGVDRWRSVLTVILPSALSGIVTGSILAIARAAGETAPLLIVDSVFVNKVTAQPFGHGVPNIPVLIFNAAETPSPNGLTTAWGAALVLLALILIANIGARVLLARNRRRMGL